MNGGRDLIEGTEKLNVLEAFVIRIFILIFYL